MVPPITDTAASAGEQSASRASRTRQGFIDTAA
jgi:hypothetical protein